MKPLTLKDATTEFSQPHLLELVDILDSQYEPKIAAAAFKVSVWTVERMGAAATFEQARRSIAHELAMLHVDEVAIVIGPMSRIEAYYLASTQEIMFEATVPYVEVRP